MFFGFHCYGGALVSGFQWVLIVMVLGAFTCGDAWLRDSRRVRSELLQRLDHWGFVLLGLSIDYLLFDVSLVVFESRCSSLHLSPLGAI